MSGAPPAATAVGTQQLTPASESLPPPTATQSSASGSTFSMVEVAGDGTESSTLPAPVSLRPLHRLVGKGSLVRTPGSSRASSARSGRERPKPLAQEAVQVAEPRGVDVPAAEPVVTHPVTPAVPFANEPGHEPVDARAGVGAVQHVIHTPPGTVASEAELPAPGTAPNFLTKA